MMLLPVIFVLLVYQAFSASAEFKDPQMFSWPIFGPQIATSLFLALVLFWALARLNKDVQVSPRRIFLFFLLIAVGVHFRRDVFFYWDEWNVLERFRNLGASGVVYTHNEHFLPIYFYLYFLQTKLFGIHYLRYIVIGLIAHAINACLFRALLVKVLPENRHANKAATVIAAMFIINAAHVEVLHWAFEASIVICEGIILYSLICTIDFLRSGKHKKLLGAAIGVAVAPFIFGGGFILLPLIAMLALLLPIGEEATQIVSGWKQRILRMFPLFNAIGGAAACAVVIYLKLKNVDHSGSDAPKLSFELLKATWNYIFVGGELGTILRGIGFFPSLELGSPREIFARYHLGSGEAEIFFAKIGFAISLLLLLLPLTFRKERIETIKLWFLGQGFVLLSFLLPALARNQMGLFQSLALRYQYPALVGLGIMIFPLVILCFEKAETHEGNGLSSVVALILLAHMSMQLFLGSSFTYFTNVGKTNRAYVTTLKEWRKKIPESGAITSEELYRGVAENRFPPPPPAPAVLCPAFDAWRVGKVLNYLDPRDY